MLTARKFSIGHEKAKSLLESRQKMELKKILYDEALKLAGNHADAKALADEAFTDFLAHHALAT